MPIYEYECQDCEHAFEVRQGFHDEPVAECPKCAGTSRRVIHPAPIIFKGSGFYVTDSKKPNAAATPPAAGGKDGGKAKGETKQEGTKKEGVA